MDIFQICLSFKITCFFSGIPVVFSLLLLLLLSTMSVGYCPGLQRNAIRILRGVILHLTFLSLFLTICQYLFLYFLLIMSLLFCHVYIMQGVMERRVNCIGFVYLISD